MVSLHTSYKRNEDRIMATDGVGFYVRLRGMFTKGNLVTISYASYVEGELELEFSAKKEKIRKEKKSNSNCTQCS